MTDTAKVVKDVPGLTSKDLDLIVRSTQRFGESEGPFPDGE